MVNIKYYNDQGKFDSQWIAKDSEFLARKDGMIGYWSVLNKKNSK